jgi:1-acyl-sn-glycerol-3-phosphate acyltransferase
MMRLLAKLIFWISGWKLGPAPPPAVMKSVMIAAPHTSNWDILYARSAFYLYRIPVKFLIKDTWFFFPMNFIITWFGGLPVNRSKKNSLVDQLAKKFNETDKLVILVPPEGTRSKVEKWKTGFYHTANQANVPVSMGYLDYKKKEAGIAGLFYPTGDIEKDMPKIQGYYKNVSAKFPENYGQ